MLGDDDGFQQHMLRLGDGACGFAAGDGDRHIHLRLSGFFGDARLGVEDAAFDPRGDEIEILGSQRRAFRRHEGLFFLGAGAPEAAAICVAGIDHGTPATANHEGTEAGRIVAGEAFVL